MATESKSRRKKRQMTKLNCVLEIDHDRGVIYVHNEQGVCLLRLCNLPRPIPSLGENAGSWPERSLDITHLVGQDWHGDVNVLPGSPGSYRQDYFTVDRPAGVVTAPE